MPWAMDRENQNERKIKVRSREGGVGSQRD